MSETSSKINSQSAFDDLEGALAAGGPDSLLGQLAARLRDEKRYQELFDARLLEARRRLGLPIVLTAPLDDLPEPIRGRVEEAYLAACREVGSLLLAAGDVRSAWTFLRPLGDKPLVAELLAKLEPDEDNLEDILEIALRQGMAPTLGLELVLAHYGTCDAITAFETAIAGRPRAEQQVPAAILARRLHSDLVESLQAEIRRREGTAATETSLPRLMDDREWLFLDNNYHIDTSHLAAAVRFARAIDDPAALRTALELTEYGRRLARQFQFAGDEPFVDVYPTHALFFRALLGEQVDEALDFFRQRAQAAADNDPVPAETYVGLLARLGRHAAALEAAATMLRRWPARSTREAPTLLELSQLAGDYRAALAAARERDDPVSYATGLLARANP